MRFSTSSANTGLTAYSGNRGEIVRQENTHATRSRDGMYHTTVIVSTVVTAEFYNMRRDRAISKSSDMHANTETQERESAVS